MALTIIDESVVSVCADCAQWDAGISADERGEEYSVYYPPMSRIPARADYVTELGAGEYFSHRACEGCGSILGGMRMDMTVTVFAPEGWEL